MLNTEEKIWERLEMTKISNYVAPDLRWMYIQFISTFNILIILILCVFFPAYMSVLCAMSAYRSQKRLSYFLELEVRIVSSH